ncbi:hypothetical protein GY45DRAFT_45571 [Cubamyces sp. BRFM 1775]|nr:hypothetical protein GY45DRAFT_45571 [Cubamyces sp. BRFM 1775]
MTRVHKRCRASGGDRRKEEKTRAKVRGGACRAWAAWLWARGRAVWLGTVTGDGKPKLDPGCRSAAGMQRRRMARVQRVWFPGRPGDMLGVANVGHQGRCRKYLSRAFCSNSWLICRKRMYYTRGRPATKERWAWRDPEAGIRSLGYDEGGRVNEEADLAVAVARRWGSHPQPPRKTAKGECESDRGRLMWGKMSQKGKGKLPRRKKKWVL